MEDKNELSDIVLEKDDNKALKTKRILVIAALLILVFLLVLVVMKVINKPESNAAQSKLVLPPEPITQEATPKDDQLFKQVPIIKEDEADKKESFEEMVKSLKEKEIQKQTDTQEEKAPTVAQEAVTTPPPAIEQSTPQETTKPVQKVVAPTKATQATASSGVYIQVGATSRLSPDKKFLALIQSKKYSSKLLPITVNGKQVTKILIGPFANTTAARNALPDVKKEINKDAFIYRVK